MNIYFYKKDFGEIGVWKNYPYCPTINSWVEIDGRFYILKHIEFHQSHIAAYLGDEDYLAIYK